MPDARAIGVVSAAFPHDEKDRERHQKDVDARKVPNDLEVGVVARKAGS